MKLHLVHGPAISESRKKISEIRNGFETDNIISLENPNAAQVTELLLSLSLIDDNRLFIFENPPKDLYFKKLFLTDDLTVIFWFDDDLTEKDQLLRWVKQQKGQIINFPESKEITAFSFLDALGYKDKKAFLELERLKKAGFDTQYIITMVYYLLRSLAQDNKKMPPFVQKKILKQRQNFSSIKDLYKLVIENDFKIKNGLLNEQQAEFNIISAFVH